MILMTLTDEQAALISPEVLAVHRLEQQLAAERSRLDRMLTLLCPEYGKGEVRFDVPSKSFISDPS